MNNLITVTHRTIEQQTVPTVNARELHEFLESKQDFSNWINNRINQYGFAENQDYLLNKIIVQLPSGKKYKNEYFITLDMAKELSMVERTAKGREARQYFIACEQQLYKLQAQQRQHTEQSQITKNANWHLTQLIHTLKNVVHQQQKQMDKIVSLHEQSLQLQAQSLELLQRQGQNNKLKHYRQATESDYALVKELLAQGYTFGQISEQLGISTYAVHGIKHDKVMVTATGLLKRVM